MSEQVIILGAKGRFGRAATLAFLNAGWQVRALARGWQGEAAVPGIERVAGDAFDEAVLTDAADNCDVIVNALNPPYPKWSRDLPRLTTSVIAAAKATGATVMIPGNIYNYGADMPPQLSENTPMVPTTRKGRLRAEMEQAFETAGVPAIVLRVGDFIEREKTGNWFDSQITKNLAKGTLMYPGPLDQAHAWAYLPDMAQAMVGLAEARATFATFEAIGFPGFTLTGSELVAVIEQVTGRAMKVKALPWSIIRILGTFMPQMREVAEMSYLWHRPHAINGIKMMTALRGFQATPIAAALREAIAI